MHLDGLEGLVSLGGGPLHNLRDGDDSPWRGKVRYPTWGEKPGKPTGVSGILKIRQSEKVGPKLHEEGPSRKPHDRETSRKPHDRETSRKNITTRIDPMIESLGN
jgi:hypothetical protein